MMEDDFDLIPIVERPEFFDDCVRLLNQEWPRSQTIRERSLKKCMKDKPDLSLILLSKKDDRLVGHVRLCLMPDPLHCWIESVIISNELRGKGIGKLLMKKVEEKAKEFGFSKAYLSTHDKQCFYEKCGYLECPPVFNVGSATNLLKKSGLDMKLTKSLPPKVLEKSEVNSLPKITNNSSCPPPPPPLVLPFKQQTNHENITGKVYYFKLL